MIIYLDQNKWIDLARALTKPEDNSNFVDVAHLIKDKSEKGEWQFPISMVHFMETCTRADEGSRTRLAKVMSKISRNKSIQPFIDLTELEFINAFSKIHNGSPCIEIDAISNNLFDALGSQVPTLEISDSVPKETQMQMQKTFKADVLGNEELFALLMKQYEDRESIKDMRKDDCDAKESWQALQTEFSDLPIEYRYKIFLVRSFMDHFSMFYKNIMFVLNKTKEQILPEEIIASQEKTLGLLESIPSLDVRVKLMYESLRNPNRPVHEHDSNDVAFLSTAIPYTDVVITERTWKHFANTAKLGEKYNTIIENDLNFLKTLDS